MRFTRPTLPRLLSFVVGMLVMCFGYALLIKPGLGAAPWDVLHLGLAAHLPFALSWVILMASVAVLICNLFLGIYPSVGMVLNILFLGPLMQFALSVVPSPRSLAARLAMVAAGVLIAGLGIAFYTSADLGSGPRDGMMLGLAQKLKRPVGLVKNGIDLLLCLFGWWLGGPLGIGTVIAALLTGPAVQVGYLVVRQMTRIAGMERFLTARSAA
jgi:uncharacterized membrane protein YczE